MSTEVIPLGNHLEQMARSEALPETSLMVQPSDPEIMVSRMTIDRTQIVACAEMGRRDMASALEKARVAA